MKKVRFQIGIECEMPRGFIKGIKLKIVFCKYETTLSFITLNSQP